MLTKVMVKPFDASLIAKCTAGMTWPCRGMGKTMACSGFGVAMVSVVSMKAIWKYEQRRQWQGEEDEYISD